MNEVTKHEIFDSIIKHGSSAIEGLQELEKKEMTKWLYDMRMECTNVVVNLADVNINYKIPEKFKGAEIEYHSTIYQNFSNCSHALVLLLFDCKKDAKALYNGILTHFRTAYWDAVDVLLAYIENKIKIEYKPIRSSKNGEDLIILKAFTCSQNTTHDNLSVNTMNVTISGFPAFLWLNESDRIKLTGMAKDSKYENRVEPVKSVNELYQNYTDVKQVKLKRQFQSSLAYSNTSLVKSILQKEKAYVKIVTDSISILPLDDDEKTLYQFACLEYLDWLVANNNEADTSKPNQHDFSVLEWATIFYYADEKKLLSKHRSKKARMEEFMRDYGLSTTIAHFKTSYYDARNRINKTNDYPISKLESIIDFLKDNFSSTVKIVEKDRNFLKNELPD
ncbi:MAG: hypothetical protein KC517_07080 [Bacteroidetes bacterium]|nr:hypothetical protein [Bacteroidota bacterium]